MSLIGQTEKPNEKKGLEAQTDTKFYGLELVLNRKVRISTGRPDQIVNTVFTKFTKCLLVISGGYGII